MKALSESRDDFKNKQGRASRYRKWRIRADRHVRHPPTQLWWSVSVLCLQKVKLSSGGQIFKLGESSSSGDFFLSVFFLHIKYSRHERTRFAFSLSAGSWMNSPMRLASPCWSHSDRMEVMSSGWCVRFTAELRLRKLCSASLCFI